MKKQLLLLAFMLMLLIMMVGCMAGPNPAVHTADAGGAIAGFWLCMWHGIICPMMFIVSLFWDNVHFYEVHNNGGWYNLGFLLGAGSALGVGGTSISQSRS